MIKAILGLVAVSSVALGMVLMKAPRRVIEAQIAVYRLVNWKMEPISWEKEVRNTRVMGAVALVCGVLTFFF